MNNEQIPKPNCETAPVTPPPFRHSEEAQQHQEQVPSPSPSPTLSDRIAAMDVDEQTASRLMALTEGFDSEAVSTALLDTLARGIAHDNDVQNADAAGYLRGRNEKIEAVLHPEPEEETPSSSPVFPRYCRRSIWD